MVLWCLLCGGVLCSGGAVVCGDGAGYGVGCVLVLCGRGCYVVMVLWLRCGGILWWCGVCGGLVMWCGLCGRGCGVVVWL